MMDRWTFIGSVALGIAAAPFAAFGQQPLAKVQHVGFLGLQFASDYATRLEALWTGLRELGYVEGRNIIIESRWAEGKNDRLPGLAAELVGRKVDVLVVDGITAALAIRIAIGQKAVTRRR